MCLVSFAHVVFLGIRKGYALLVGEIGRPQSQLQFQLLEVHQEEQVRRYDTCTCNAATVLIVKFDE